LKNPALDALNPIGYAATARSEISDSPTQGLLNPLNKQPKNQALVALKALKEP
jgi:hypothetical protein